MDHLGLIATIVGLVLGGSGGGLLGWSLTRRRLTTVEEPQAVATVEHLRAEADKLRAEARGAEVEGVLKALEGVSTLWQTGETRITEQTRRIDDQALQIETLRATVGEVSDLVDRFTVAWDRARDILGTHGKWDQRASPLLRQLDPAFPDPPPLDLGEPPAGKGRHSGDPAP